MSKYIKKEFSPHLFHDWVYLFKSCTPEQRSELLLAITDYPNYQPNIDIPVWSFIKSQLENQYLALMNKSQQMSDNRTSGQQKSTSVDKSQQMLTEVDKDTQTRIKTRINNNNIYNILNNIGKDCDKKILIDSNFSCSNFDVFKVYTQEMPDSIIASVENWLKKQKNGQEISIEFIIKQFFNFAKRSNVSVFK